MFIPDVSASLSYDPSKHAPKRLEVSFRLEVVRPLGAVVSSHEAYFFASSSLIISQDIYSSSYHSPPYRRLLPDTGQNPQSTPILPISGTDTPTDNIIVELADQSIPQIQMIPPIPSSTNSF